VEQYGVLVLILIVALAFAGIIAPGVLSVSNLSQMTVFGVEIGLIAFGETLVILGGGGGIDLSVGSMLALSQIIIAVLVEHGVNVALAAVIGFLVGGVMGAFNGFFVVQLGIPAIIVTLATLYGYSGLALVLSNGVNLSVFPPGFDVVGQSNVIGLPFQFIAIYVPVAIVMWYITSRSLFGYHLRFAGTNERAAWLSGINVAWVRFRAYLITGLLCGLAAIIQSSRFATARPDAGSTDNLQAIAIAVLGGTSIFGGQGSIVGTILATAVVTVLSYSFGYANINSVIETGAIGAVLIVTVIGQTMIRTVMRRRRRLA